MVKIVRWAVLLAIAVSCLSIVVAVGFRWWIHSRFSRTIYPTAESVPEGDASTVAIVFGAGLWRDNRPSPILFDRIQTSVELYRSGKVRKLLMSGDNRFLNYNEPAVMRETALAMGVPDRDIIPDFAGRRTFDTCYRAKEIFGVQNAVLVTQRFHLDRAMYLCDSMGIKSIGVVADRQPYSQGTDLWSATREVVASLGAWFDLRLLHPMPVMGEKIPIDFTDKSKGDENIVK